MALRNALLVLGSILVTTIMAEAAVRVIDGYRFLAFPLDGTAEQTDVPAEWLDKVPLAPGVDRAWFADDPPPLPNRKPISEEWRQLFRQIEDNPRVTVPFAPSMRFAPGIRSMPAILVKTASCATRRASSLSTIPSMAAPCRPTAFRPTRPFPTFW